ncbi:MAG: InlB B-repeat-containing protein [Clostridia bacterium]|nr:InlB B-repeat-containing protein [Clostridia bacterium]
MKKTLRKALTLTSILLLSIMAVLLTACFSKDKVKLYVDGKEYAKIEVESDTYIDLPEDPYKEGYEFMGWFSDEDRDSAHHQIKTEINENGEIVGRLPISLSHVDKYYACFEKLYYLSFDAASGKIVEEEFAQKDGKYVVSRISGGYLTYPIPEKEGNTFVGWKLGDEFVYEHGKKNQQTSFRVGEEDKNFVAVWNVNYYTINTYSYEGYSDAEYITKYTKFISTSSYEALYGSRVQFSVNIPSDYKFLCWYNVKDTEYYQIGSDFFSELRNGLNKENIIGSATTINMEMPAEDLHLVAIYFPYRFTSGVTNQKDGGTISQTYNGQIAKPGDTFTLTATVNEGYTFNGWYANGEKVSDQFTLNHVMGEASFSVYARFDVCPISVEAVKVDYSTVVDNSLLELPTDFCLSYKSYTLTAKPLEKYLFDGWYLGDKFLTHDFNVDIDVKPVSNNKVETYQARYIRNRINISQNIKSAGTILLPEMLYVGQEVEFVAQVFPGHKFVGWYILPFNTTKTELITEDNIFKLKLSGESARYIATYTENKLSITQNIAEAGDLTEGYVVTYDYCLGGSFIKTQTVNSKKPLVPPEKIENGLKVVTGWYMDKEYTLPFEFGKMVVNGDITLYAKWQNVDEPYYADDTRTYAHNGNSISDLIDYTSYNSRKVYYYSADYDQSIHLQMQAYRYGRGSHFHINASVKIVNETTNEILYNKALSSCDTYDDTAINQNLRVNLKRGDIIRIEVYYLGPSNSDGLGACPESASDEIFRFRIKLEGNSADSPVSINCVDGHYHEGEVITLKTDLKEGYTFDGWYIGETCIGNALEMTYIMPNESINIEARYSLIS